MFHEESNQKGPERPFFALVSIGCGLFEKSTENILKNTASSVPKRQIENVTRHLSQDFDAFYKTREIDVTGEAGILVLSCDGKGIVMRQDDLRDITKKAAQAENHKKRTRLSRGCLSHST